MAQSSSSSLGEARELLEQSSSSLPGKARELLAQAVTLAWCPDGGHRRDVVRAGLLELAATAVAVLDDGR